MLILSVFQLNAIITITLNYHRYDNDYQDWGLHIWENGYNGEAVSWNNPVHQSGRNDFGVYWDIPYKGEGDIFFIIHKGDEKDPEGDRKFSNPQLYKEIWTISGNLDQYTNIEKAFSKIKESKLKENYHEKRDKNTARINYYRFDSKYTGWGLHVWGEGYAGEDVNWINSLKPNGKSEFGIYWDLPYNKIGDIYFIIHRGDLKDLDGDRTYQNPQIDNEIWTISNDNKIDISNFVIW